MVSFVSRRYMRVINGSLGVWLSEYLPLGSVLCNSMVCLAYSNRKKKCQNYRKISRNVKM